MKAWAEHFYLSKTWRSLRDAYLKSQHYVCERCGEPATIGHHKIWLTRTNINDPNVTLSWSNLEALCQDCHNKEHHQHKTKSRYTFDADGNICYSSPSPHPK